MKQKPPSIVPVLILTLLTAVTWVFFSIYRAVTSKPDIIVHVEISEPLDATLDKKTLDGVGGRLFLDESQIPITSFSAPTPGSSALPSPVATSAAMPLPSPGATGTASPSGTLSP